MSKIIQAVKGMNDVLPEEMNYWHFLEAELRELVSSYGYEEIRTPVLEKTDLFQRSIGEVTDIVSKEMYTFEDRDGTSLTLRPEGTASVVRAGIERGLFYNQVQRLWYLEPIFRHERPQRGRYRQFYQFGLEAVGFAGPEIEVEQILFLARLWKRLGIAEQVELQINSLGSAEHRIVYRKILVEYLTQHVDKLDEDSRLRLHKNPLRILDSKNPAMQELIEAAPKMLDYLDDVAIQYFQRFQDLLSDANIKFTVNPRLVRGLDYYSYTVFEWVTEALGAQGTVAAGGRYDALIEHLGGQATEAFGFAMGMERVVELLQEFAGNAVQKYHPDIYFILVGEAAQKQGLILAENIRDHLPQVKLLVNTQGGNFKNQFKKADKSAAAMALILGDDEVANGNITIKYLREDRPQQTVPQSSLIKCLTA